MPYDPRLHHRRSIRLKDYDYSLPGDYFLTICTQDKRRLLGSVIKGRVCLSHAGMMVSEVWRNIPTRHTGVELDTFVVMPNHVHGIVRILYPKAVPSKCEDGRTQRSAPTRRSRGKGELPCPPGAQLAEIVRRFKSITTGLYRQDADKRRWRAFSRRLWQRNYFERVIRNREELTAERVYIDNNPIYWSSDPDNPDAAFPL